MDQYKQEALSKVLEVTLIFWIIKIAATALGETGGDTMTMTLDWGYLSPRVAAGRGATFPSLGRARVVNCRLRYGRLRQMQCTDRPPCNGPVHLS